MMDFVEVNAYFTGPLTYSYPMSYSGLEKPYHEARICLQGYTPSPINQWNFRL